MPRGRSNKNASASLRATTQDKAAARKKASMEAVDPVCGPWIGTQLVESDFDSRLIKSLAPFKRSQGAELVHTKLKYTPSTFSQAATVDGLYTLSFAASSFNGFSDLTSAFDQYKLMAVDVALEPMFTSTFGATGDIAPRLYTAIDYDDAASVSIANLQAYGSCIVCPPLCGVIRTFVPHQAVALYSGAFTSFGNILPQWVDAASPGVLHYGLKMGLEAGQTGQTALQRYSIEVTGYFAFRSTR